MSLGNRYLILTVVSSVISLVCCILIFSGGGWLWYLIGTIIFLMAAVVFGFLTRIFWNAKVPTEYMLEICKVQYCSKCGEPLVVKIESFSMEDAPLPIEIVYYCPHIFTGGDHTLDLRVNLKEESHRKATYEAVRARNQEV